VNNLTHIPGKYSWSPAERDEEHWSSIPRRTVENIYKHYYADFLLFGYSPQEVLGLVYTEIYTDKIVLFIVI
jgi:hypothetical protein